MSGRTDGLGVWRWLLLPAAASVVLTVLLAAPIRLFGLGLPEPVFPLVLAFSWSVIRPSLFGPVLLLLIGLFLDLFWGGPLGLWPLCLLLVYGSTLVTRTLIIGQDPAILAGWYVAAVLAAFFTAYLISALQSHVAPSLLAVGLQLAVTAALFPVVQSMIAAFEDGEVRFR